MCPIVSANWNNGATAGVWALNLNNVRTNANNNVGGRADSEPPAGPHTATAAGGTKGGAFWRMPSRSAQSVSCRPSRSAARCGVERRPA